MARLTDEHLASVINTVEALCSSWDRTTTDSERRRIKNSISEAMRGLTNEQLFAYKEYQKERLQQTEQTLEQEKKMVQELEAEKKRRDGEHA